MIMTMHTCHEILSLQHNVPSLLLLQSVTAFNHDGRKVMVSISGSGNSLRAQTPGLRCAAASRGAVGAFTTLSAWSRGSLGA